jgi:hypothetical protein
VSAKGDSGAPTGKRGPWGTGEAGWIGGRASRGDPELTRRRLTRIRPGEPHRNRTDCYAGNCSIGPGSGQGTGRDHPHIAQRRKSPRTAASGAARGSARAGVCADEVICGPVGWVGLPRVSAPARARLDRPSRPGHDPPTPPRAAQNHDPGPRTDHDPGQARTGPIGPGGDSMPQRYQEEHCTLERTLMPALARPWP